MLLIFIALAVMAQTLLNGDLGVVQGQKNDGNIDETEYETDHPDDYKTDLPEDNETEHPDDIDEPICEISSDPKQIRPSQCCQVGDILPIDFKEHFYECEKTNSITYQTPAGYTEDPWTLWVHHTSCLDECIFDSLGLLNTSLKIDQDVMREAFTDGFTEPVYTALNDALDNCFAIYKHEIEDIDANSDLECQSGSTELLACYMKEVFLHCPANLWPKNNAPSYNQCSKLWTKIENCPEIHVMLHQPSLPQTKTK